MEVELDAKAAALLEEAFELMNDEGSHWIKYDYSRDIGGELSFCSAGAMYQVVVRDLRLPVHKRKDFSPARDRAFNALARQIREKRPGLWTKTSLSTITGWNDSNDTEWRDVAAMFKKAIKSLKN